MTRLSVARSKMRQTATFRLKTASTTVVSGAKFVIHRDNPRRYLDSLWRKTFRPDVHEKLRRLEPLGTVHLNVR
jgi:hypothetical protein